MSAATLIYIQNQINTYGNMVAMIVGSIGNIFILLLFSRQRQNACSIYLINFAIANLYYLIGGYFLKRFATSFTDESIEMLILCKFSVFIPAYAGHVVKTLLLCACIDRYLITNRRATFRALSTPKRAKYAIVLTYFICFVITCHIPIFYIISNGQCTRLGIYAIIYPFYAIFFVGWIPSIFLSIFAYLTYRNMKYLRRRIQPGVQGNGHVNQTIQRRDHDLLKLVIAEVIVYVITTALFPAVQFEMLISQYILGTKSVYHTIVEIFAFNISIYLMYLFSAAPFYIYIIVSASFRQDFAEFIVVVYHKLVKRPVNQVVSQTY